MSKNGHPVRGQYPWSNSEQKKDGKISYGGQQNNPKQKFSMQAEILKRRPDPRWREARLLERLEELRANPPRGYPV